MGSTMAWLRRGIVGLMLVCGSARFAQGQEPSEIPVTGRADPALAPFDELMTHFVREQKIPGASLAVARRGKLVYARGFGYADVEAKEPVRPDALFRIASVTKPFTAVAVMQLAQEGKLKLDDKAFPKLGLEAYVEPGGSVDPRVAEITVLELLRHTAGWDRAKSGDPMFMPFKIARLFHAPSPPAHELIIRYMMGRPLDFDPGARHAYSNFGFCVLGRVIERASGEPYEAYVKRRVLAPLGITRMRIGGMRLDERAPGEVMYYDAPGAEGRDVADPEGKRRAPPQYGGWSLQTLDSHGGWIASSVDLVRFASAFVDSERCPLLNAASVDALFSRPEGAPGHKPNGDPLPAYYACGWMVRPVGEGGKRNIWHNGSLPGTSTLLVLRHDGLTWAVLFNTRLSAGKAEPAALIDGPLHAAADKVKTWPEVDLFGEYLGGK